MTFARQERRHGYESDVDVTEARDSRNQAGIEGYLQVGVRESAGYKPTCGSSAFMAMGP